MFDQPHLPHRPPLGSHRLLGQGKGAALIRPNGEIDWWCRDRFESTPLLWSLLDPAGASSRWADAQIAVWDHEPAGPTAHSTVHIGSSRARLWDGLIIEGESTALVRLVRLEAGEPVELTHSIAVGGFDAPQQEWTVAATKATSSELVVLGGRHAVDDQGRLTTTVTATADRWRGLVVLGIDSTRTGRSIDAWVDDLQAAENDEQRFLDDIPFPHDHPSRVVDALRVLRVLTDVTTGAPVASPTTSLPELPGGHRQYDYRYAWLRDAAYAVATAALLGRTGAARDYLGFVAELLDRYGDDLPPVTTTTGDPVPTEREVGGVTGWASSLPIRVGNAAAGQRQLDSPSTVLDAIHTYVTCGGRMTAEIWTIVDRLARALADAPFEPTSGIWELREPQLLVTDELARWIGLNAAERISAAIDHGFDARAGGPRSALRGCAWTPRWIQPRACSRNRSTIRLRSIAATLLAVIHGFYAPRSPKAKRLARATIAALEEGPFLRRHPISATEPRRNEGAFIPVSWWAVTALAVIGDLHEARRRADEMCLHLPPLVSEEWSVEQDEALGNTPLLWSHTEAARALYQLHEARIRHRFGRLGLQVWRAARVIRVRVRMDRSDARRVV